MIAEEPDWRVLAKRLGLARRHVSILETLPPEVALAAVYELQETLQSIKEHVHDSQLR